jgi:hypothetical protein
MNGEKFSEEKASRSWEENILSGARNPSLGQINQRTGTTSDKESSRTLEWPMGDCRFRNLKSEMKVERMKEGFDADRSDLSTYGSR